jgi:hypothetical protein
MKKYYWPRYGRLGHGISTGRTQVLPLLVEDLKDKIVIQIACGACHCICLADVETPPNRQEVLTTLTSPQITSTLLLDKWQRNTTLSSLAKGPESIQVQTVMYILRY